MTQISEVDDTAVELATSNGRLMCGDGLCRGDVGAHDL